MTGFYIKCNTGLKVNKIFLPDMVYVQDGIQDPVKQIYLRFFVKIVTHV